MKSTGLKSMLKVDFRRMFTMPLAYIMVGICVIMPILILVMTTMLAGTTSVDPQTGVETTFTGFDSVWQIIGTLSGTAAAMDLTGMCNINLVYFLVVILVCVFVAADFRSGFAKNLFTVRAKKADYVTSKSVVCLVVAILMVGAFFIGSMVGGAIAGLPFTMLGFGVAEVIFCLLAKLFVTMVFVAMALVFSVVGKQRLWLAILCSLGAGMLLFTMIPLMTPLNANILNVVMCFAGGALFMIGLGTVSGLVLQKTNLV